MKTTLDSVCNKEIVLNNDQVALVEAVDDWLKMPLPGSFLLDARAGSGKTSTVTKALRGREIFLAAPTHRALNEFRKRFGYCEHYATTHSLLSAQPQINLETGELEFITGEGKTIGEDTILVIDECSMIASHHVKKLEATYCDHKRLYIGDSQQLPPVKESIGAVFDLEHQAEGTLTKIERYSGDILEYATNVLNGDLSSPEALVNKQMSRAWKGLLRAGLDCKVIAYTNKAVDAWNLEARETVNGLEATYEHDWIDSDPVILKAPIPTECPDEPIRYHTNEPATIYNVRSETYDLGKSTFPIYRASIHFTEMNETIHAVRLMSYKMKEAFEIWRKHIIEGIAEMKIDNPRRAWAKYYKALDDFVQIKHNYASTCHSTQGATIANVFLDTKDIAICRDKSMRKKLIYTGLTRSSSSLTVNG